MRKIALAMPVLHAVGLPVRGNDEFILDAIEAVASWKRWSHEGASKWLAARARAAQEAGTKVDKWFFVNGDYRDDPRARDAMTERPLGDPNCRACSGSGWRIVARQVGMPQVMRNFAERCGCRANGEKRVEAATPPQIGALSDAKNMETVLQSPPVRVVNGRVVAVNASNGGAGVAGPSNHPASGGAKHEHELHQRN